MGNMSIIYDTLLSLHAEMVLDHAIKQFRIHQLYTSIDQALAFGDAEAFYQLTSELNSIQQEEQ